MKGLAAGGIIAGLAITALGGWWYSTMPFQRSPEPLFFILDMMRFVTYVPVFALMFGGPILVAVSIYFYVAGPRPPRQPPAVPTRPEWWRAVVLLAGAGVMLAAAVAMLRSLAD